MRRKNHDFSKREIIVVLRRLELYFRLLFVREGWTSKEKGGLNENDKKENRIILIVVWEFGEKEQVHWICRFCYCDNRDNKQFIATCLAFLYYYYIFSIIIVYNIWKWSIIIHAQIKIKSRIRLSKFYNLIL